VYVHVYVRISIDTRIESTLLAADFARVYDR